MKAVSKPKCDYQPLAWTFIPPSLTLWKHQNSNIITTAMQSVADPHTIDTYTQRHKKCGVTWKHLMDNGWRYLCPRERVAKCTTPSRAEIMVTITHTTVKMKAQWVWYEKMLRQCWAARSGQVDVIGGQHTQTKQLSSILGSSVLTSNKSIESSSTTSSATTPHRDTDTEILESLVEELQRISTLETPSPSLNNSHTSSSTPQTTQTYTPRHRP